MRTSPRCSFRHFILLALPLSLLLAGGCTPARAPGQEADEAAPPAPLREFRGAWIATVDNIDWPSRRDLSTAQQQAELIRILDEAAALNLNAVVLQVRPAGDALYPSALEPWSEYLTGQMGRAPEPHYDPLAFAVEEAHRRGLELHAWFNPFRVLHPSARSPVAASHVSRTRPEIVRRYGRYLWLDPGEPAAQDHSIEVMLDVVRRYDIDAVHLDDYFYPYKEQDAAGREIAFPDSASYARAVAAGVTLGRDDWRRNNVDRFVERLYREIKAAKPWVRFGISPFGIWRPGNPPQIQGFDAYAGLYADARKWLRNGWVDYFSPQLYWAIEQTAQSYPVLLDWWVEQNEQGRHLWPGNFTSRVASGEATNWSAEEILAQIRLTREHPGASGNIHFSMKALLQNRDGLADKLKEGLYAAPALVPASPWLGDTRPGQAEAVLRVQGGGAVLELAPAPGDEPWLWVVRARSGDAWTLEVLPGRTRSYRFEAGRPDLVVVSAVDRLGNEGPSVTVRPRPL